MIEPLLSFWLIADTCFIGDHGRNGCIWVSAGMAIISRPTEPDSCGYFSKLIWRIEPPPIIPSSSETGTETRQPTDLVTSHDPAFSPGHWVKPALLLSRGLLLLQAPCGTQQPNPQQLVLARDSRQSQTQLPRRSLAIWPTNWPTRVSWLSSWLFPPIHQASSWNFFDGPLDDTKPQRWWQHRFTDTVEGTRHKRIIFYCIGKNNEAYLAYWICLGCFFVMHYISDGGHIDLLVDPILTEEQTKSNLQGCEE